MTNEAIDTHERAKVTIPFYWWIGLLGCLLVGLGTPIVGQFFAPLHILTHEFTQLHTVLTGLILYFLARWVVRSAATTYKDASPIDQMRKALFPMLIEIALMGIITLAVMYVANVFFWTCRFHRGVPFFAVTWPPVAVSAAVGGILVGMCRWGWLRALALLLLIAALSGVQDFLQCLNGTRVVDFVIGEPLALNQRKGMAVSEVHVYQRMFVILLVYSLWHLGLWRFGRSWAAGGPEYRKELRHIGYKGLFSGIVAVAAAFGLGSNIGVGWGRAALNNELSEVHRTAHFVFRYAPGRKTEHDVETIASGAEWYWQRLCRHWNVVPDEPVEVYVFDDREMDRLTGIAVAHAGPNWICATHAEATSRIFYHELVHALHPAGFSPKLTVWLNRGIVEGLAEAYARELVWLPEAHRYHAGALKAGKLPSATEFMPLFGFWRVHETLAYDAAASFIGFLIYEYGVDTFRKFQEHLDYEPVFGKNLSQLDIEWKRFLETVPLDVETQIRGGNYFDAAYWGAYSRECCPKLGKQHPDLEDKANWLWWLGHYDRACEMYKRLLETTGEVRWGYQSVLCLQRQHLYDEALELLDDLSAREDLSSFDRIRLLKARTSVLMRQQDWPALYGAFDELAALEGGGPSEDQRIVESLLRQSDIRASVAEALLAEDAYKRRRLLEELAGLYPDNVDVQYLYVSRAFGILRRPISVEPPHTLYVSGLDVTISARFSPTLHIRFRGTEWDSRIRMLLDYIETVPAAADKIASTLLYYGVACIQAHNYELAALVGDALRRHSTDPLHRFRAERLLERVEFEREHTMSLGTTSEAGQPPYVGQDA